MARLMDKLFSLTHELCDMKKQVICTTPCHPGFISEITRLTVKACSLYPEATELDHASRFNGYVRSRMDECKRKIDLLWSQLQSLKHQWDIEMTWQEANRTLDPRHQTLFSSSDEESIVSFHHARQQNRQQQNPPSQAPTASSSANTTSGLKSRGKRPRSSNRDHEVNSSSAEPPRRRHRFNFSNLSSLKFLFFRK